MKIIFDVNGKTKEVDAKELKSENDIKKVVKELLTEDKEKPKKFKENLNNYKINPNKLSPEAFKKLSDLDESFIGTKDYMGIAWFWNYEYRHWLRDVPYNIRKKIHDLFLDANLNVHEESEKHLSILEKNRNLFKKTNNLWK